MIPGVTIYAGCATIATGQIMRYHQYPVGPWHWPSIVNNNEDSIANFIYDIYQGIDCSINSSIDSSDWSSGAEIEDVKDYLTDIGYNAQQVSHSTGWAKASLSLNRPVYMRGETSNNGSGMLGFVMDMWKTRRKLRIGCWSLDTQSLYNMRQ